MTILETIQDGQVVSGNGLWYRVEFEDGGQGYVWSGAMNPIETERHCTGTGEAPADEIWLLDRDTLQLMQVDDTGDRLVSAGRTTNPQLWVTHARLSELEAQLGSTEALQIEPYTNSETCLVIGFVIVQRGFRYVAVKETPDTADVRFVVETYVSNSHRADSPTLDAIRAAYVALQITPTPAPDVTLPTVASTPEIPTITFQYEIPSDDLLVLAPVRIRSTPGESGTVLGSAQIGDRFVRRPLETVEADGVEWAPIRYDEQDAWIGLRYLTGQALAESTTERVVTVVPEDVIDSLTAALPDGASSTAFEGDTLTALNADGNLVAAVSFTRLDSGEISGDWREITLFATELPAYVTEETRERMTSLRPNGVVSVGSERRGNADYIWGYAVDDTIRSLWNTTPDGGEWVELRIDDPADVDLVNPEVFDQIPGYVKQSYLYSVALGGYFRIQEQYDGQHAVEVFMPRLVGFYDVSTNTTSQGWARLYDTFFDEQNGTINILGVGNFENQRTPVDFRGAIEGDDVAIRSRIQHGYHRALELMLETADGELNARLSPNEAVEFVAMGTHTIQLIVPNDWETWDRQSDVLVEQLRLRQPNLFSEQTVRPDQGLNVVFLAEVLAATRLSSARWLALDYVTSDWNEIATATGFSVRENGGVNVFIFFHNRGNSIYSRFSIDSLIANIIAKLVKHARSNPPSQELSFYMAHPRFLFAVTEAMGLGSSTAEAERLIGEGLYDPIIDATEID